MAFLIATHKTQPLKFATNGVSDVKIAQLWGPHALVANYIYMHRESNLQQDHS